MKSKFKHFFSSLAVCMAMVACQKEGVNPVTAINEGTNDGHDDTEGDAAWIPFACARVTPPLPTYPGSYAAGETAGEAIFNQFFGKKEVSLTITSYALPGVERSYTSVSQLAGEMGISRIYVGPFFRNDGLSPKNGHRNR